MTKKIPRFLDALKAHLSHHQAWLEARLLAWVAVGCGLESLSGTFDGEMAGEPKNCGEIDTMDLSVQTGEQRGRWEQVRGGRGRQHSESSRPT